MADTFFPRGTSEFDRALAFFDNVYAFALTLLVTSFTVPMVNEWQSFSSLWNSQLPSHLSAFALSFLVISQFWRINHKTIGQFSALNSRAITMNLIILAAVALLPFSTTAISTPDVSETPLAAAFYAGNIVVVSTLATVLRHFARRDNLSTGEQFDRHKLVEVAITPAVFLLSIPVNYIFSPDTAKLLWLIPFVLIPVYSWATRFWKN